MKKLSHNKNETVQIGKTLLYYHSQGYYCTEPEINGYLGTNTQNFKTEDRAKQIKKIENKRERMNFTLLLESVDWSKGNMCQLQEYQSGRYIFGVCNFYDGIAVSESGIPSEKIKFAVFYRIDCIINLFEILCQRQDICAILCTETYIIYQTDTALVKEEFLAGKKKNLLLLNDTDNLSIKFQAQIFLISYLDKFFGFYWHQKDCLIQQNDYINFYKYIIKLDWKEDEGTIIFILMFLLIFLLECAMQNYKRKYKERGKKGAKASLKSHFCRKIHIFITTYAIIFSSSYISLCGRGSPLAGWFHDTIWHMDGKKPPA